MTYKTFIVTGASQGIGKATALGLANIGTEVVLLCRDRDRGLAARAEIIGQTGSDRIHLETADLSSLTETREVARRLSSRFPLLHGLINNHAALFPAWSLSAEDLEMTFALNRLAPFLLTNLLLENLRRARGRIVNVSARVHLNIEQDFLDQPPTPETYNPWEAYCQSKLCNILFTYALARRLPKSEVTVNCLHPGTAQTLALKTAREIYTSLHGPTDYPPVGTFEAAADTSLYLAASPEVREVTGKYFIGREAVPSSDLSYDIALQEKLWKLSSELTQLEPAA